MRTEEIWGTLGLPQPQVAMELAPLLFPDTVHIKAGIMISIMVCTHAIFMHGILQNDDMALRDMSCNRPNAKKINLSKIKGKKVRINVSANATNTEKQKGFLDWCILDMQNYLLLSVS